MNEYPYFNPYAPYMPMQNSAYPPANQIQGVRFVSNRQEAESCAVPRGTKALLMDSNKDIFYLKETDMNGISTISEYSFKKVEPQTADNYKNKQATADLKYSAAMNTASINENTTAQTQKILDALAQDKIESLQAQVSELKTQNMFCGVPRISPYGYGVVPNFATPCGCNGVTF